MNIIILIFAFLAVMALSTTSFWQTATSIRLETSSFSGSLTANREADNALQRKLFKNLPSLNTAKSTDPAAKGGLRQMAFHSHRLKNPPHQYARLQLAAIWAEQPDVFVENTFLRLLNELYGHTSWFGKAQENGEVDALLAGMIRFGKKTNGSIILHELFSSLSQKQTELLYKMIKGTHTFNLAKKNGYPPLLDFVSFSAGSTNQTCRFSFASLPLLRACFDEKTVSEILSLEETKWEADHKRHTCTKKELLSLIENRPLSPTQPSMLDTHFHFSRHAVAKDQISGHDIPTGIHIERRLKKK